MFEAKVEVDVAGLSIRGCARLRHVREPKTEAGRGIYQQHPHSSFSVAYNLIMAKLLKKPLKLALVQLSTGTCPDPASN